MKSAKVSGQALLRESVDPCVSEANDLLKSGNCLASEVVEQTEKRLSFKQVLGYCQSHRAGFGSISILEVLPKHLHAYRKLLASMVEEADEKKYLAKAVQVSVQGQWEKWCSYVCMDLLWETLLVMPQHLLPFCLKATYNTLPSPNLHYCHINPEASCLLYRKKKFVLLLMFLEHVLWPATGLLQNLSGFCFKCPGSCSKIIFAF